MGMFNDLAKLNEEHTKKQADDATSPQTTSERAGSTTERTAEKSKALPAERARKNTTVPRHHDSTPPRNHATTKPSGYTAMPLYAQEVVDTLRTAVKQVGRMTATTRFTEQERKALDSIEYEYKQNRKIRTSANEMIRIAI